MEFNTILFIIFFLPLSVAVYYLIPSKYKNHSMLVMSCIYCGLISLRLLAVTCLITTFNYFSALYINKSSIGSFKRKSIYTITLLSDILLFFILRTDIVMKYIMPMYSENKFLPVCVSFFMLNFIGYIIDVFRQKIFAEKNYSSFLLYILFFPKYMMGPVVKYSDFYSYMKRNKTNLSILGKGLMIFVKGLFKNSVIGIMVYQLYNFVSIIDLSRISALSAWLGISGFILSFYFCLSGILEMANGLSYCFGYKFINDFEHPIFTMHVSDFFSKWHISTVRWFENYISFPTKLKNIKYFQTISIIFIWVLIGLWYEISLNMIMWGMIIGISIILEKNFKHKNIFFYIYTILVVFLGFVFFSQDTIIDSIMFLKALAGGNNILADEISFYLLKSYIVIILIALYASTDLFKNLVEKIKDKKYLKFFHLIMPLSDVIFLIVSIAFIVSGATEESFSVMFG